MNIVINHHKDFKWLRFVLLALKNNYNVEEKRSFHRDSDSVSHSQELAITDTQAIFTERDERDDRILITKMIWKRGKMAGVERVEETWYKTKAAVEKTKADFAKYLEQNPHMKEWGAKHGIKEYRCLET